MAVTISGSTGIAGVDGSASTPAVQGTDTNTGIAFPAADTVAIGTGGTERMRVDSSGNVGIGTASPITKLDVGPVDSGDEGAEIRFRGATNATMDYGIDVYQSALRFFKTDKGAGTGFAERARINAAGRFLVNTTSEIDVGRVSIQYNSANSIGIGIQQTNSGSGTLLNFLNSGGTSVGNIGTNGTTTAYTTTSDYRLKEDVAPLTGGLATIAALKPSTYRWNTDNTYGEGFIAHELAEHIPLAVSGEKDAVTADGSIKPQGVDYSKIVVHLVAAVQELKAEIASLKARVAALEATP